MAESPHKLSLILSCFNEEGNLKRYSSELIEPLSKWQIPFEILLIDDGSSDGTYSAIRDLASRYPNVIALRHDRNLGLGAGLRTGISNATGDAIMTLDADLTFHPREASRLMDQFDAADIVMGSPFLGALEGVPFFRKILSRGVNGCYSLLLGRRVSATSSIFRLYHASLLKSLSLESRGFDINAEILFKAIQKGARIKEVPATLTRRTWGNSKIGVLREILNHLKMFFRIMRWRMRS